MSIIANNINIYPQHLHKISEGKIACWRYLCEKNMNNHTKYTQKDFDNFMDVDTNYDITNMINLTTIQEKIVLGEIEPSQIVFLAIDSNVVCKYDILEEIKHVRQNIINKGITQNPIIVFIDTYVSQIENEYKLQNKHLYQNVNFEYIENYFKFTKQQTMFYDNSTIDYSYNVNFHHYNKIVMEVEQEMFKNVNERIDLQGIRQEINDNVQLKTLLYFKNSITYSNVVFLTQDKSLKYKCFNNNIHTSL